MNSKNKLIISNAYTAGVDNETFQNGLQKY